LEEPPQAPIQEAPDHNRDQGHTMIIKVIITREGTNLATNLILPTGEDLIQTRRETQSIPITETRTEATLMINTEEDPFLMIDETEDILVIARIIEETTIEDTAQKEDTARKEDTAQKGDTVQKENTHNPETQASILGKTKDQDQVALTVVAIIVQMELIMERIRPKRVPRKQNLTFLAANFHLE